MSREYQTVSIYPKHSLKDDLELRGDNRSQIINRDLARLYSLYRWSATERFWVQNPPGNVRKNIKTFFGGGRNA